MKAVFSKSFNADLLEAEANYGNISDRLASAFQERVAGQVREIIKWHGGDHVGPHGFPCRRTRPFPFYIYYAVEGETLYFSVSCMNAGTRTTLSGRFNVGWIDLGNRSAVHAQFKRGASDHGTPCPRA